MIVNTITELAKLPTRPIDAHKGTFGKILIIGGSLGMSGAPALAGKAALRTGAGLVRIATPTSVLPIVAAIDPCYTTTALVEDNDGCISDKAAAQILSLAHEHDIIAFGPGATTAKGVRSCLNLLIAQPNLRIVIDADGLNCLAATSQWREHNKASLILTPHPGEMKRLWQSCFRSPMPEDRTAQATELAKHTNATVVLKGASTVVADSQQYYINTTGNPGMATAGSGDVLTGIIAALAAQHLSDFDAATLGTFLHGLAGDMAARKLSQYSLIATDIINALGEAFIQTIEHQEGIIE